VAEVEFASAVEQGLFDVLLQNVSLVSAIVVFLLLFQDGFDFVQVQTHDNTVAPVRVLARFHNPRVVLVNVRVELGLFHFLDLLRNRVKVVQKLQVLIVFKSVLDVESQRQVVEHLFALFCVVLVHQAEQSFLVTNHVVVYQVVVDAGAG
jgi:hypothetical protein